MTYPNRPPPPPPQSMGSTNTVFITETRFDPSYLKTLPGILKVVVIYHNIKWLKIEFVAYVVMVFLYLIASTIVVAFGAAAYSAAGVCSLLGFICIQFSYQNNAPRGSFFSWISMIAFWFTGILLGFYLFHIVEKFYKIPWLKIEFLFCALWTLFYLIVSILATTVHDNPHSAAAFFGFVATLAYGADCLVKWRAVRGGGLAQGTRVVSKQTTSTVESPPPRQGY